MTTTFRHLSVSRDGDLSVVRFKAESLRNASVMEVGEELSAVAAEDGCRKLVLNLSDIDFVFSDTLGRIRRRAQYHEAEGRQAFVVRSASAHSRGLDRHQAGHDSRSQLKFRVEEMTRKEDYPGLFMVTEFRLHTVLYQPEAQARASGGAALACAFGLVWDHE